MRSLRTPGVFRLTYEWSDDASERHLLSSYDRNKQKESRKR